MLQGHTPFIVQLLIRRTRKHAEIDFPFAASMHRFRKRTRCAYLIIAQKHRGPPSQMCENSNASHFNWSLNFGGLDQRGLNDPLPFVRFVFVSMKSSAITRLFFWTRLADTRTVHGRIKYGMSTAVDYDDCNDTRRTEGPNLKRDFVIETTAYASRWDALFHPISGSYAGWYPPCTALIKKACPTVRLAAQPAIDSRSPIHRRFQLYSRNPGEAFSSNAA